MAFEEIIVQSSVGPIHGERVASRVSPKKVRQFLSIPYAEPPVGDLRFRAPQACNTTKNPVNVNWQQHPSAAPQVRRKAKCQLTSWQLMSGQNLDCNEDCLYLNVWSPDVELDSKKKLPVMVWMHGGGFVT